MSPLSGAQMRISAHSMSAFAREDISYSVIPSHEDNARSVTVPLVSARLLCIYFARTRLYHQSQYQMVSGGYSISCMLPLPDLPSRVDLCPTTPARLLSFPHNDFTL
jgi:hypothetical protein